MAAAKAPGFFVQLRQAMKRWKFNTSTYNKYGLLHDDLIYEDEVVTEALRRLPQEIKDVRNYRLLRAIQCSLQHDYLPRDQWTKFEDDVRYLEPYVEEVTKEFAEKHAWNLK